jgi:hypothetical protein
MACISLFPQHLGPSEGVCSRTISVSPQLKAFGKCHVPSQSSMDTVHHWFWLRTHWGLEIASAALC